MIKKTISIILVISILSAVLAPLTVFAEGSFDAFIEKLLSMPKEDRDNLFVIIKPMLITDDGLNLLIKYMEEYDENGDSIIDKALSKIIGSGSTEEIVKALKILKAVPAATRKKYLDIYQNKTEMTLNQAQLADMEYVLELIYDKSPSLKTLLREDGVTPGVIANILKVFNEINDSKPLIKYSGGSFVVNHISPTFESAVDGVEGAGTLNEKITEIIQKLNSLSDAAKTSVNNILVLTGISLASSESGQPSGGGPSGVGEIIMDGYKLTCISAELTPEEKEAGFTAALEVALYKDGEKCEPGELPKTGYVKVAAKDYLTIICDDKGNTLKYSFIENGELTFKVEKTGRYLLKENEKYFSDTGGWSEEYIEALYLRGIIGGKGEKIFAPKDNITREEFVKLIIALTEFPDSGEKAGFSDVAEGSWYEPYVNTAAQNGIIGGIGDNMFGVGLNITRQDMAKIIYGVIKKLGIDVKVDETRGIFADSSEIADYAAEGAAALKALNIIGGDENGNFNPKAFATREEAAKIIYGLLKLLVLN